MLRNTSTGSVHDTIVEVDGKKRDAWPPNLELAGFTYGHLGRNMLARPVEWYADWLSRDAHSPQPYKSQPHQQLATLFREAGYLDNADTLLYAARDRELAENWREGKCRYGLGLLRLNGSCWHALGLAVLKVTIGYGLGSGYFLALVSVAVFTAIGTGVLWFSPTPVARAKGPLWCVGASLNRLLPIVELNKEFTDFFNDPERERLAGWQLAYFASHAVIGYVLAFFVVAGLAGLTQKS